MKKLLPLTIIAILIAYVFNFEVLAAGKQGERRQVLKKSLTEVRSSVAQQVQELLATQPAAGGIGEQVREWARIQQQSEVKIQEQLQKMESRSKLARSLLGPDYKALYQLKGELERNQLKIQQLEQLNLQLKSQGDYEQVQEMVVLLQQENMTLQDRIILEESDSGLFGWLIKRFAK